MAEAIGVASGVITFIDSGKKVLDLCIRIKDAPENIAAHQHHLEYAVFNVENLKKRLQSSSNSSISISRKDLDFVENLLDRCTKHLRALQGILESLNNQFKGGRRRHAWASLVAVHKSGQILDSFNKLQHGLDSLKNFLVQQNFWILHSQSSAIAAIQTSLADLTASQSQNTQDLEQSFASTSQRSAEYIVQELNRMLQSQTSKTIPKLDAIYAVSARRVHMDAASQIGVPAPTVSQRQYPSVTKVRSASTRRCTCKARPSPTYRSLGGFYYWDRTRNVHESTCPLREKSAREVSFGLKIAIPAIFAKVVQLVVSADFGAGGISISPAIKFPSRIVDRRKSEGFQLLDSLIAKYSEDRKMPLEDFCESVVTQLFPLLENGSVSAHDQDETGATLLWVFCVAIGNFHGYIFSPSQSDQMYKVIRMMIKHFEADANVIVNSRTIMDVRMFSAPIGGRPPHSPTHFGEKLLQSGCEIYQYKKQSSLKSEAFSYNAIYWSYRSSELAFDFGYPDHYYAIFNRSLDGLKKFIRNGTDWEKDEPWMPPAISVCALGWPEGLRTLLQIGVNPIPALRVPVYMWNDSIPVLIAAEYPPFPQPVSGSMESVSDEVSMLQYVGDCALNLETRRRVVNHVAESRRQLAAWGLKHLPHESPERRHIEMMQEKGYLLDECALSVWSALKTQPVPIPDHLFPGRRPSVYHWVYDDWCRLSDVKPALELLFESGFTDVDIKDDRGRTAFWNACQKSDLESTDFLASKGAETDHDTLRKVIRNVDRDSNHFHGLPQWIFDLEPQITRDGCRCYCSSCGCTPVNILAKDNNLGHTSRRILLPAYISRLRSDFEEESWLEACRLEMFERLGMAHTCCEGQSKDCIECFCRPVAIDTKEGEYQDEKQDLVHVIEKNILIYAKLRARFGGDLDDFLRAWWAAVDLFLPRDDTIDPMNQSADEAPSQWCILPGLVKLHQSHDEFDEAKIWTVVQYYFAVVDSVTEFFNGQISEVESDPSCHRQTYHEGEGTFPEELSQYLYWLNVPLSIIKWLDGSQNVERSQYFEPSRRYRYAHDYDYFDLVRSKRDWMKDSIIPLVTAGVITDLNEGREIPESLYKQLEKNGLVMNGLLRPLEDQEDIFEQGMQFLGL